MPFVSVYYPEGLSNKEELKKVSNSIHKSLIEHFEIPENDYFQMFFPYPPNQFFYDPYYLLEEEKKRTENILHVSITCGPGRTINQKKRLYQSISRAISNHLNISTTDIFIILNETSAENWSFGQGVAQLVNMREGKNSE
ncbi:tautomerase family protein [Bacillus cereus]|uniref:tautomerase family protein n=1 Tax=Bacillus TaxID=1386 RepID=UPI000676B330|nr:MULTISPECIES: tautomerase family protein [Bacillus cereus group]AKR39039.1 Tautomerase YusQ [Bacillus thuringiensis serovar indiana]EKS7845774.1 tautomerase family protein [Bacillus cereus]MBG9645786.1 4-oxalocrotonate tautomerase [Bacillus thuringiensis]MBG9653098.1 4-oxalocrotonate tautomerase [Bacillus thuringiensis]MDI6508168.1 tautomerase family protein [Bacillus wiedmannii]